MAAVIPIHPISSWSYSRLSVFEQCKLRAKLAYIDKIPEPERPLPPGKTEHANDRGTRIHTAAELYVQGRGEFAPEMEKFRPEFEALRRLYDRGQVSLEGEWGMDREWNPVAWGGEWRQVEPDADIKPTRTLKKLPQYGEAGDVIKVGKIIYQWIPVWQRLKLDALVFLSPEEAVVIDYKTGKKFGNEIKHNEQTQLYQINTFLRYPELEVVHTELWYLDQNELTQATYRRNQGLRFRPNWDRRANTMTTATEFPANPNVFTCKWCPYGKWENGTGTGHCERGVRQ